MLHNNKKMKIMTDEKCNLQIVVAISVVVSPINCT